MNKSKGKKQKKSVRYKECPFCARILSRDIATLYMHVLKQHPLTLSQGEIRQLMTASEPPEYLKQRMDAALSAPLSALLDNQENEKSVSDVQQQAMRKLEQETHAAVSAKLKAPFAKPQIKQGLAYILSHKKDIEKLIQRKWAVLQSGEFHFSLDRARTYPVLVEVPLLQNMGFSCLYHFP